MQTVSGFPYAQLTDPADITAPGASPKALADYLEKLMKQLIPIGSAMDWAGASDPANDGTVLIGQWMTENGRSLLRASYPDLFSAIGTTYGAVDGTHFSLPNCKGRVIVGEDAATGWVRGEVGGDERVALGLADLPVHHHDLTHTHGFFAAEVALNPGTTVGIFAPTRGSTDNAYQTFAGDVQDSGTTPRNFVEPGAGNTGDTGSGATHDNMQPYLVMNKIIRVK